MENFDFRQYLITKIAVTFPHYKQQEENKG
jgi:hypothetical protein